MLDVNEALSLEKLDDYISEKNEKLNQEILEYNDLAKKYRSFVNQYKESMLSLGDSLNKKIESMHNMIDSFISSYELLAHKIASLEGELLKHNDSFNGEISKGIEEELLAKMTRELKEVKKQVANLLDSYINEYDECQKQIDKSISKLQKLKTKIIKNIE
ncbi:MAG: hypothetical protein HP024_05325 [Acholeplasmatales bacterium]|nr:hypothetical protein [Acholeplasmatales bacterium]